MIISERNLKINQNKSKLSEKEKKMKKLFDKENDNDLLLEINEVLDELSEKFNFDLEKSDYIDFYFDESDNSIHIKLIDRYLYRDMIIFQRNEMIYIDLIEDYQRFNIFSINSIILDEILENDDILLKFIREYLEKIFIFDEL
jgi:hypothetical protein